MSEGCVLVFARAPVAGRCKTRLIPAHGARGAARWHQRLAEKTLAMACASGLPVQLWCAPDSGHGFFQRCRRRFAVSLHRQPRGDLGRKMALALRSALRRYPRVVLVGTDCAALTPNDLHKALAALGAQPLAIQAAEDGGYVLIAARTAAAGALRDVDWSSGREYRQTLRRCARLGLQVGTLPPLWDIDHPHDLRKARRLGLV